jgi:hypothetical protein
MSWLIRSPYPEGAGIPELIGVTTVVNAATSASFSVSLPVSPGSWAPGDLLVLYTLRNNLAFTTVPAGWNLFVTRLTTGGTRVSIHYKTAQVGETAPTISFPSATMRVVYMAAYRKSSGTPTLIADQFLTDFTSPYSTSSITTSEPGLVSLGVFGGGSGGFLVNQNVTITEGGNPIDETVYDAPNRGTALTHFDGTVPGTFGAYGAVFTTTVDSGGCKSILVEIR